mgnify:CR=1 FL=1
MEEVDAFLFSFRCNAVRACGCSVRPDFGCDEFISACNELSEEE